MWVKIEDSNYLFMFDTDDFKIFPQSKTGTAVVTIKRRQFFLKHITTGEVIEFRFYLHQKRWYWSDSRQGAGNCGENHALSEIARLLFKRDVKKAQDLVHGSFLSAV